MSDTLSWPRSLDHCVLPTFDLETAADRLSGLGFAVAPLGEHPFGTANRCVYFADGTFLEPLAVVKPAGVDAAIAQGNVFLGHDREFRLRNGEEGFSAVVFGTDDAKVDHAAFIARGASAGEVFDFSRPFRMPTGETAEVSFRLAFAKGSAAPDVLVFTCERINATNVDRGTLLHHANGATGIRSVSVDVGAAASLRPIAQALGDGGKTFSMQLASSVAGASCTARLTSITFDVPDLEAAASLLRSGGVFFYADGKQLVIPAAAGQGTTFIFEA